MANILFVLALTLALLSCNFVVNLSVESPIITTEQSALLALKGHVTDDPKNLLTTNWSTATSVCNWIGVVCGSRHPHRITTLDLSGMGLNGTIPPHLGNLSFLSWLNISYNKFHGSLPIELSNLRRLKYVDFGQNNFTGEIPAWFSSFRKLRTLILDSNNFTGVIPSSLGYLSKLEELNLSDNYLKGQIPVAIGNLSKLKILSLRTNLLSGHIPANMFDRFPKLKFLYLDSNNLTGRIPASLFKCKELERLFLRDNSLEGSLPTEIKNLTMLKELYLNTNNLEGSIPLAIFNISSLQRIALGSNKLSGHLSSEMFDRLPHLQFLGLRGNQLSGKIPASLFKCKQLQYLYLFDNLLEGNVPSEIGNLTLLKSLDINNSFTGEIPSTVESMISLRDFHFSGNNFTGRIPTPPPSLNWLFISENKLVGEIPSSICNLSSLKGLDLSNNNLGGIIPQCFGNLSSTLLHIDLRMNKFTGVMPGHFPKGCLLRTFSINSNQLVGSMPPSLLHCKNLKLVDLGNNKLHDTFPNWLGKLKLQVLVLRSNRFYGRIDDFETTFSFSHLRIMDLSDNDFTGNLPRKLFENLNFIKDDGYQKKAGVAYMRYQYYAENMNYFETVQYEQSVFITVKGLEREFVKILSIFTAIDFSNNGFTGQIPEVVGELHSLILLNLSHNSLTGPIPSSLGNLSLLESLDLSSNKLQHRIPAQLKNLIFLEVLNLTHNNLTGPIPQGNQLDTFTNSSYEGNLGLCGFPLSNKCSVDLEPSAMIFDEDDDISTTFHWQFSLLMGYGCGLVLGFSIGYIVFTNGKPRFFIRMVQRAQEKYVKKGKIRRN